MVISSITVLYYVVRGLKDQKENIGGEDYKKANKRTGRPRTTCVSEKACRCSDRVEIPLDHVERPEPGLSTCWTLSRRENIGG